MSWLSWKRALVVGAAALTLGGSALGVASAQQPANPTPPNQQNRDDQFVAALASKLGLGVDQVRQAVNEVRTQLRATGQGQRGAAGQGQAGVGFKDVLEIGYQLRQELPNRSLADVARAHNVDPSKVADALKAEASTWIDQLMTRTFTPGQRRGPGQGANP